MFAPALLLILGLWSSESPFLTFDHSPPTQRGSINFSRGFWASSLDQTLYVTLQRNGLSQPSLLHSDSFQTCCYIIATFHAFKIRSLGGSINICWKCCEFEASAADRLTAPGYTHPHKTKSTQKTMCSRKHNRIKSKKPPKNTKKVWRLVKVVIAT